ncbi:MAG: bla regulator protein blaR1 [Mucilaginibacter sp.]|nr:bla regulator protein blaR1 [Mucilaginibacter sp.]
METILYNISQVLGITIIHSLWQGLLIYFALRLALTFSARLSASKKYILAITGLLAITGWFIYTLVNEITIYNWISSVSAKFSAMPLMIQLPAGINRLNDQGIRYYYSIEEYLPYIAVVYVTGLIFNTTRLMLARTKINTIKQTMSIDIALQQQVNKFTEMLGITHKIAVGLTNLVDVPCMVGYFKPVIFLPFTLSTYLSAQEVEAILLHELAHVKRNDYLVNMIQQVVSVLLFFNPCALLINRIINEERENCCDDLVVKATADPIIYAKALLKLEQTRQNDWKLALAATGKKYHLLNRIERIMKTKKPTTSLRPALAAMLILTMGICIMTMLSPQIALGKISVKAISPIINTISGDTSHKTAAKKTGQLQAHTKKVHHTDANHYASTGNDKKMNELNAEIQQHAEALGKYYNNENFKKTQEEIEQLSKQLQQFYNRPEVQKQQEELSKASADFSKNWGDNDKQQELSARMGETGKNMGVYFNSPEFKKLDKELRKKYGIPLERNYNDGKDENYKKYQDELAGKLPADIKRETDELKRMGEQMSARFNTPEFKEQNKRMQALGDSIRKAYENPELKEKQKEMEKLGKQMSNYQNRDQIKKEQQLLGEAVRKMNAYVNSPAFRNHIKQLKNMNYNYNFNDNLEKPGKPDAPEKIEKPEKPEAPEPPNNQ